MGQQQGEKITGSNPAVVAGIDVGSLSAEAVLLEAGRVVNFSIIPTGVDSRKAAEKALTAAMESAGLQFDDLAVIVATGYGRISIPFAHKRITEITCHGRGAFYLDPAVRTVIDIGGQDSKVIRLNQQGKVLDFAMNDKCAAGTGRFLEVMATALEVELENLAALSDQAVRAISISSTCTVFAETEVVSLLAGGADRAEIARGLHESIAARTSSLVYRVGLDEAVMMTGGVAKNSAVVKALEEKLQLRIIVPPEPQIAGALGAALLAWEDCCAAGAT
ncbi:MAG TPA: acyl-CoA dehydratase activase [Bacillota bacterium]|jgi:predicted CoA-substrate-specific enzyme activase|nr:acyl-CoA dehydratase activase [Bacillota bacterium]HOB28855.1 acyl-CoA dehydratase activase [Bacillota bacterium]HPZ41609.1 acyl-CoA dehydratase activase [Bacillota bacterium]HQD51594.1 acyl-CoA dehydratase activase [Bacillota bacterium]